NIRCFRTAKHHPVTTLAVRTVGEEGERAVIIDGSARIDPYWMVRVCKRYGYGEKDVLGRITVGRGFTVYQLIQMVDDLQKEVDEDGEEDGVIFLGLVAFTSRFSDDDIDQEEALWLRSRYIKKIRRLVEEQEIYCACTDENPEMFTKRHGGGSSGKERTHVPAGT
ncbi:MAG: hypothetical protein ACQESD_06530, partial [Thermoplasmatota archaeon]